MNDVHTCVTTMCNFFRCPFVIFHLIIKHQVHVTLTVAFDWVVVNGANEAG